MIERKTFRTSFTENHIISNHQASPMHRAAPCDGIEAGKAAQAHEFCIKSAVPALLDDKLPFLTSISFITKQVANQPWLPLYL